MQKARDHMSILRCAHGANVITIALLMLATSFILSTQPSYAYTLAPCKWRSASQYYYNSSNYANAGSKAADDWTATPTPLNLVAGYLSDASIVEYTFNFGNTSEDGVTFANCTSGYFTSVASYWNTFYTFTYSLNFRISVMVHELGHATGLGHAGTSNCKGQPIMYYSSTRFTVCGHIKPQTDDVNGINHIY